MSHQPVPALSDEDVVRLVRREFAEDDQEQVLASLNRYGSETWHREVVRTRVAILKLANGSTERLAAQLKIADSDYRDIIASAEYPGYMDYYQAEMPEAEKQKIIDSDWHQYQQWLRD